MDIYLYSKRIDLAATTLADLTLLVNALADETDADNAATIARVTAKIESMVQIDTGEVINVYSYDDAGVTASGWVTDAAVAVALGLGDPDPSTGFLYATATGTISGQKRTATIALNTTTLQAAMSLRTSHRRFSATFFLHIRKTESAVTKTVALLPVEVSAGVLS